LKLFLNWIEWYLLSLYLSTIKRYQWFCFQWIHLMLCFIIFDLIPIAFWVIIASTESFALLILECEFMLVSPSRHLKEMLAVILCKQRFLMNDMRCNGLTLLMVFIILSSSLYESSTLDYWFFQIFYPMLNYVLMPMWG
jgi:hypothetical protein